MKAFGALSNPFESYMALFSIPSRTENAFKTNIKLKRQKVDLNAQIEVTKKTDLNAIPCE